MEKQIITFEDWEKQGIKLFGKDKKLWKFKCVSCGHVQTIQDFIDHKIKEPETLVFYSCLGRWVKGIGCDWTLGGLIQIHKIEILKEGRKIPSFEFAENDN